MRTMTALALLALAAGASACGGSTEGTGGEEKAIIAPTTPTTTTARSNTDGRGKAAESLSCVEQGIAAPPFNEGTCVQRGIRYVVGNGRSVVRMRTLSAAMRGLSVAETIPSQSGAATPQGVFVLIRLSVKNRTSTPQRFHAGQTQLMIREQPYEEHVHAEQEKHAQALAFAGRAPIKPGEVVQGDLIYDVPLEQVNRVASDGTLYLVDFDAGAKAPKEFGQIRIYRP